MNNLIRIPKLGLKNRSFRLMTSKATDYNESYATKKEKTIHSGGFKRDHDDKETKKAFFNCDDEKWFSTQLSSNEDYKNMKIGDEGNGSKLFPYRYGNSFWDADNYKLN